jgi:Fe-S cluster assembly protein SufD
MNQAPLISELQTIAEVFESELEKYPGSNLVKDQRILAFNKFMDLGFPNKSNEEYKYSTTEKLFKNELHWKTQAQSIPFVDYQSFRNNNPDAFHLFLVNGNLVIEESDLLSLSEDCIICDLQTAALKHPALFEKYYAKTINEFDDAFAQVNTAMASKGLFIYIAANAALNKPIQINNICGFSNCQIFQTHHIIVANNFSNSSIIETFQSIENSNEYILNTVAEVTVNENASFNYYKLQNENHLAVQINTTQVNQFQNSHFDTNTVTLGGKWLRNNLNIVLKGTNCESHLNGLQILKKQQHVDNHTLVDHQMPHCESNQLYKGILNDKSTGVFNGKIFVRKDAQKTNAYQSSKNMLLSDDATMNTKPQLEIYADDVKCSHGSSTGQIDASALFYLRARGLSPESAKSLLMYAFAVDVIQTIKIDSYKNYLEGLIEMCFE